MAKRGTYDHPKTKRLARLLKIPKSYAYGMLCALWDFTQEHCRAGDIGKYEDYVIEEEVDWNGDEGAFVEALVTAGWLDVDAEHRYIVHDWPDHCEDIIHRQLARAREFFADGSTPNLTRLADKERQTAENYYKANSREITKSSRAHVIGMDVRTNEAERAHETPLHEHESAQRAHKTAECAPSRAPSARARASTRALPVIEPNNKNPLTPFVVGASLDPGFSLPWGTLAHPDIGKCRLLRIDETEGEADVMDLVTGIRWECFGSRWKRAGQKAPQVEVVDGGA